jgi:hypothetical protein
MKIKKGKGDSEFGTGIDIKLTGNELAKAVDLYLYSQDLYVSGARTIRVNGDKCKSASVYIDPSGSLIKDGERISGRTGKKE